MIFSVSFPPERQKKTETDTVRKNQREFAFFLGFPQFFSGLDLTEGVK